MKELGLVCILLCFVVASKAFFTENYNCDIPTIVSELKIVWPLLSRRDIFKSFVEVSCFLCSELVCDYSIEEKCDFYESATKEIPLYNNMAEFAFMTDTVFFAIPFVKIYISDDSFIRLQTIVREKKLKYSFEISEENPKKNLKEILSSGWKMDFNTELLNVISFTVKVYDNSTIFINYADSMHDLSTSRYFRKSLSFTPRSKIDFKRLSISYHFRHDFFKRNKSVNSKKFLKHPVILPCSPGGYAVEASTGELTKFGTEYNTIVFGERLQFVIKHFYPKKIPIFAKSLNTYDTWDKKPIYIDKCGKPKPREAMERPRN